jgi:hypothetical protein
MTTKLLLQRIYFKSDYTIGKLYLDSVYFSDTLELPYKSNMTDVSCIPAGIYKVEMQYSEHFKRNLPHLIDVHGRTDILIHPANSVDELKGCIAIGKNTIKGGLTQSRACSDRLNDILKDKQDISITVYI